MNNKHAPWQQDASTCSRLPVASDYEVTVGGDSLSLPPHLLIIMEL